MVRYGLSPQARADLLEIHDYVARDSPDRASELLDRIEGHCSQLATYPYMGVARPEFGPTHRLFVVPKSRYVIVYRPASEGVEILHVRHGARDIRRLFE